MMPEAAADFVLNAGAPVGDAFDTDILGARRAGLDTLLIASGIHRADLTPLDDSALARAVASAGFAPRYACTSFRW